MTPGATDESKILTLINNWSHAVRNQDLAAIRAHHAPDILMFDVPPPFQSTGLEAYMATWDTFYSSQVRPIQFHFRDIRITAGNDVAFASAIGSCRYLDNGTPTDLDFRLTMGLQKQNNAWQITHEHHSIPAL